MKAVNRFLRRQVTISHATDFQLALESNQPKVNLLKPNQTLPGLEDLPMFKTIVKPTAGIVYPNLQREKKFLRFDEVAKYSDGTLKMIVLQLRKRLEIINKESPQIIQIERFTIEKALEVIEDRLDYRKTI